MAEDVSQRFRSAFNSSRAADQRWLFWPQKKEIIISEVDRILRDLAQGDGYTISPELQDIEGCIKGFLDSRAGKPFREQPTGELFDLSLYENLIAHRKEQEVHFTELRQRIHSIFDQEVQRMGQLFDLREDHIQQIPNPTILLASEDSPRLERRIEGLEEAIDRCKSVFGVLPLGAELQQLRRRLHDYDEEPIFTELRSEKESAEATLRTAQTAAEDATLSNLQGTERVVIGIGLKGEAADDNYLRDLARAEIAHLIVHSALALREGESSLHPVVDEFYELALRWVPSPQRNPQIAVSIMKLHSLYLKSTSESDKLEEAAAKAAEEIVSQKEEGDLYILNDSLQEYERIDTKSLEYEAVRDIVQGQFEKYQSDHNEHILVMELGWRLTNAIMDGTGWSAEQSVMCLPKIASKTFYDGSIDFTSPENFVKTLLMRIEDYLAD